MMKDGYRKIFWGIFTISFGIYIGAFRILPTFVGWMMIGNGIKILMNYHHTNAFMTAGNLAKGLVIVTIVGDIIYLFGKVNSSVIFSYYPVILMIIELIFVFKIFEGTIELLKSKGELVRASHIETNLDSCIRFFVVDIITYTLGMTLNIGWILLIAMLGRFLINVYLLTIFNKLSKLDIFEKDQDDKHINDRIN